MKDLKLVINGYEVPNEQIIVSEAIFDNKLTGRVQVRYLEDRHISTDRVEHQLEALRWLQGKTSDEFVTAWIGMYADSLEAAGGTPR